MGLLGAESQPKTSIWLIPGVEGHVSVGRSARDPAGRARMCSIGPNGHQILVIAEERAWLSSIDDHLLGLCIPKRLGLCIPKRYVSPVMARDPVGRSRVMTRARA